MKNILINILAFGTLLSSILVITSKNPVIAVIFLISVFCNAAGYLILLGVGFIGISYILLYVGAITVLFLFVIMMINIKLTDILETGSQYTKNLPLALAIGSLFIYEIFTIMPFTFNNVSALSSLLELLTNLNNLLLNSDTSSFVNILNTVNPTVADTTITSFLHIQAIGHGLYTYGASLLIICSVILLLAMTAPIFISRKSNF
jgi:NADH-ubiquinone oxidoreductase chain 6